MIKNIILNRLLVLSKYSYAAVFQRIPQQQQHFKSQTFKTPFMNEHKVTQLKELQRHRPAIQSLITNELQSLIDNQVYGITETAKLLDLLLSYCISFLNAIEPIMQQQLLACQGLPQGDFKAQLVKLYVCMKLLEVIKTNQDFQPILQHYLFRVMQNSELPKLNLEFMDYLSFNQDQQFLKGDSQVIARNRNQLQLGVLLSQLTLAHRYIINCKSPRLPAQDSQFIESLLEQITLASMHLKIDWRTSYGFVKVTSHYASKLPRNEVQNLFNRYGSIISRCIDEISGNVRDMRNSQVILLMFMVSKMNINTQNIRSYIVFWQSVVGNLSGRLEDLKPLELKSLYYSLGKVGFINNDLRSFIVSKVKASISQKDDKADYMINLLISSANLNLYQYIKSDIDVLLEKIYNYFESSTQDLNTQILSKLMVLFYLCLLRLEITNDKYWSLFFQNFQTIRQISSDPIGLLLQDLIIYKNHFSPELNHKIRIYIEEDKEVTVMIESFKEAFNSSKYFEKGHEQFQLENNIEKCLISLGEEFKRNQMFTLYECDFYLPNRNLIVEVMGPHHFVFSCDDNSTGKEFNFILNDKKTLTFYVEYNLVTKSKLRKLAGLGYEVKTINFFDLQTQGYEDIVKGLF